MSLLHTNITKVKKLSLKDIKLPAPERRVQLITTTQTDRPGTDEEILYSKLVDTNPLLEELVERLGLVSITTGEKIKKVDVKEETKLPIEPDKTKLIAIAHRVIERENSYNREEIITRIKEIANVSRERAERGFNLILEAGAIEPTPGGRYYLTSSTPF